MQIQSVKRSEQTADSNAIVQRRQGMSWTKYLDRRCSFDENPIASRPLVF